MIRDNQRVLNTVNLVSDAVLTFLLLPVSFWLRFYVARGGVISVPLRGYLLLAFAYTALQLVTFAAQGLYPASGRLRLRDELYRLGLAGALDIALVMSWLFLRHEDDYSRLTLAIFFALDLLVLSVKRLLLRALLRRRMRKEENRRRVLLVGAGEAAADYLRETRRDWELGYRVIGYVAGADAEALDLCRLGDYGELGAVLERCEPDEVVCALDSQEQTRIRDCVAVCERFGCKLSLIPFYAAFFTSHPRFDELNGIPLLHIRYTPLDERLNAFCKRALDIVLSALLLVLLSPLMVLCAIGVKLSSPGPVFFCQRRVGRDRRLFTMYKFRSMVVNAVEETAWSRERYGRRTRFGAWLRKLSLDELPQLWNVLRGDMSLVGPRPELPHFVERFREEIPLYMLKHRVRPGMTGWAQINGLRGDTSIQKRIEYDLYYIENWTLRLDIQILLTTLFRGKFINGEKP